MANQKMGIKVKKLAGIILGAVIGLSGCGGSGTNNDQGTSFLARNYSFADGTGAGGDATGFFANIYDTSPTAGVLAAIDLQNRLSAQYIIATQISCTYEVPGSSVALYQDSFNSSSVIDANGTATLEFPLVSGDVLAYFANRTNELPQLPFRMNVQCYAIGISQAGDVFQTNTLGTEVILTEEAVDTGAATTEEAGIDETLGGDTTDDTDSDSSSSSDSSAL